MKINNTMLQSFSDYSNTVMSSGVGDVLKVTVMRRGQNEYQEIILELTVGNQ